MKNRRKLADKTMNDLNSHTQREFKVLKEGNDYVIQSICENEKGQIMTIRYVLQKSSAQLQIVVNDCECTKDFIQGRLYKKELGFPLFAEEPGEAKVCIKTQISLKDLGDKAHLIAEERMDAMILVMKEIISRKERREFLAIKKGRKLACKIMEYVNAFTPWDFWIYTNGEWYGIGTMAKDDPVMIISFVIREDGVQLLAVADGCKFDTESVRDKIDAKNLNFAVFPKEMEEAYAIVTSMSLDELDNEAPIIVRKKIPAMLQIMDGLIHESMHLEESGNEAQIISEEKIPVMLQIMNGFIHEDAE